MLGEPPKGPGRTTSSFNLVKQRALDWPDPPSPSDLPVSFWLFGWRFSLIQASKTQSLGSLDDALPPPLEATPSSTFSVE